MKRINFGPSDAIAYNECVFIILNYNRVPVISSAKREERRAERKGMVARYPPVTSQARECVARSRGGARAFSCHLPGEKTQNYVSVESAGGILKWSIKIISRRAYRNSAYRHTFVHRVVKICSYLVLYLTRFIRTKSADANSPRNECLSNRFCTDRVNLQSGAPVQLSYSDN